LQDQIEKLSKINNTTESRYVQGLSNIKNEFLDMTKSFEQDKNIEIEQNQDEINKLENYIDKLRAENSELAGLLDQNSQNYDKLSEKKD